jgi:hypothetical protein
MRMSQQCCQGYCDINSRDFLLPILTDNDLMFLSQRNQYFCLLECEKRVDMATVIFMLYSLPIFFLTDNGLIRTPKETNIVATENEKAVLPCQPTSSEVNMTLYKGVFSWSMKRVSATLYAELNSLRQLDCMYGILMANTTF